MKKVIKWIAIVLAAVIVIAGLAVYGVWHNEISSAVSFHQLRDRDDAHEDGAVYEMTMHGDYYLDDFVAQGGVANDSELISFILQHITKGVVPVSIEAPEIGCSSFTAETPEGNRIFARNYDMHKTNTCIVHTNPGGGRHASVSSVDLSYIGMDVDKDVEGLMNRITCLAAVYAPLDGMNDAGVACGVYMTYQGPEDQAIATNQNTDKPDFTTTTFLRMVLDYADDIDDAIEMAQAYDMHDSAGTSFHYMVADPSGRSAILEWVADSDDTDVDGSARTLVVHYNDDDAYLGEEEGASDFQWTTNFINNPDYYDDEENMKGLDRYDHIYEQLSATDGQVENAEGAMDILASVGRRLFTHNGTSITVHSAIYDLTAKEVYWVPNENYNDEKAWFTWSLQ